MGKKIDRFILSAAAAAGLYFLFADAFGSRALAILLALLCGLALRRALKGLGRALSNIKWIRKRRIRRDCSGALMRLACLPSEAAEADLRALIRKSYREDCAVCVIQSHPSIALSPALLFDAWRAHRDAQRLAICATCRADAACRALAESLSGPKVALIDADVLGHLIAEHPEGLLIAKEKSAARRLRLKRAANLLINRKNAPRNLLFSGAMLMMYLFTANAAYLFAAAALVLLALAAFRRAPRPVKLF